MELTQADRESMAHNAELEKLRLRIMAEAHGSRYDHRPLLTEEVRAKWPHMLLENQLQYARFKLAAAKHLTLDAGRAINIFEVGVGWGVSARAMIAGAAEAGYGCSFAGIDNEEMGIDVHATLPGTAMYRKIASDELPRFEHPHGAIDLLHLDGGHGYEQKQRDVIKALQARPEWLMIDDVHDVMVARGTFEGFWRAAANPLKMLLFENSHTCSLLLHVRGLAPEIR
jgi:hypothetical protein